jgi:hypothetical protein
VLSLDNILAPLKKHLILYTITSLLVIFFTSNVFAQYKEYGGGIGVFNYTGDLSPKFRLGQSTPGISGFYFLDYKHPHTNVYFSPYFFAGFGIFRFFGYDDTRGDFGRLQPIIPFGVGIKQLIGKRYAAAIEFGLRKTFFDYLDSVSDADVTVKNYQYGNPNSNDWYYFTGISVTYILYEIPCRYRYVPNRYEYN